MYYVYINYDKIYACEYFLICWHELSIYRIIPLMPVGNYSYQFFICCPRDCVSRHNGGTRGAPIMPRDTVSRTANEKLVTIVANRH